MLGTIEYKQNVINANAILGSIDLLLGKKKKPKSKKKTTNRLGKTPGYNPLNNLYYDSNGKTYRKDQLTQSELKMFNDVPQSMNEYFAKQKADPKDYEYINTEAQKWYNENQKRIKDEKLKTKTYVSEYNPETKILKPYWDQKRFSDPELNPVQDVQDLTSYVVDETSKGLTTVKNEVSDFFDFKWYTWLMIGAGGFLLLYLFLKMK